MEASAARSSEGVEPPPFLIEKHRKYVLALQSKTDAFEYVVTEFLRMSGVYWGLTTMHLLSAGDQMDTEKIAEWVVKCQHESVRAPPRVHWQQEPDVRASLLRLTSCRCSLYLLRHLHPFCQRPLHDEHGCARPRCRGHIWGQ
jgi:prenyltransferase beta subunit